MLGAGRLLTLFSPFITTQNEFFTKGIHSRNTDNSVVEKINIPASKEDFLTLARKKTGEGLADTSNPASHIFTTNGTIYFIEPLVSPKPKRKWMLILGIITICCLGLWRMCDGGETKNSMNRKDSVASVVAKKDGNVIEIERRIVQIMKINRNEMVGQDKYSEYLDSLMIACILNDSLKSETKKRKVSFTNFDLQIKEKVQTEYQSNLKASKNEYLPASAKAACVEYLDLIKSKAKHYYK